jgi:hypothetical protein
MKNSCQLRCVFCEMMKKLRGCKIGGKLSNFFLVFVFGKIKKAGVNHDIRSSSSLPNGWLLIAPPASGNKDSQTTTTVTQRKDSCVASAATKTATRRHHHGAGNASGGGGTVFLFVFVPPCYGVVLSPLFRPWILA